MFTKELQKNIAKSLIDERGPNQVFINTFNALDNAMSKGTDPLLTLFKEQGKSIKDVYEGNDRKIEDKLIDIMADWFVDVSIYLMEKRCR